MMRAKGKKMTGGRTTRVLMIVLAVLGLGLAGCGKKGDLAPPPSHADPAEQDEAAVLASGGEETTRG